MIPLFHVGLFFGEGWFLFSVQYLVSFHLTDAERALCLNLVLTVVRRLVYCALRLFITVPLIDLKYMNVASLGYIHFLRYHSF